MPDDTPRPTSRRDQASVGEVIDYVKTYAKQETLGPLRGAGRWVGLGAGGAIAIGAGLALILLGLLRLLQSEVFDESRTWSWVPYLIVLAVCGVFILVAVMQINKTFLNKEDQQ